MSQSNAEYINEIISALEVQRNQALKQAAESTANANLVSKQLASLIKIIKDRKLEKFFADEEPQKKELKDAKKPEKKQEKREVRVKKPELKKPLIPANQELRKQDGDLQ
jgi:hypothetical protein